MSLADTIESTILQYPICEYAFAGTGEIPFSEKVLQVCEKDCKNYGKNWTCPPFGGPLEEKIQKCRSYTDFCLFSTITETENLRDRTADRKAKRAHEQLTARIQDDLKKVLPDFYILSSGCMACQACTCPDAPCRYPERQLYSLESHGILVVELADALDLSLDYGEDTVAWFSMILFREGEKHGHESQNQRVQTPSRT